MITLHRGWAMLFSRKTILCWWIWLNPHSTATKTLKKPKKAYSRGSGQKCAKIRIFSQSHPSYYKNFVKSMNSEKFQNCCQVLSKNFLLEFGDNLAYCIFDNVRLHMSADNWGVLGSLEIKRLHKNRPFLNMAENAISAWKTKMKSEVCPA